MPPPASDAFALKRLERNHRTDGGSNQARRIIIMGKPPWQKYRVGKPSTRRNWTEPDCQPFDEVTHVTHVSNALAIIPKGIIQPRLIDDASILNTRRILVNWVSPNQWTPGYRYGNVAFELEWSSIIRDKNLYWVEVMPYNTAACRILITDKDYDADPELRQYDPTVGDGPWWYQESEDVHYRNSNICLEFMLEFEISTAAFKKISFVKHHATGCCIDASFCPDKGMDHQEAAARFLAGVVSEGVNTDQVTLDDFSIRSGWWWSMEILPKKGYRGVSGVTAADRAAPALARSVLAAYYRRNDAEFLNLSGLFADKSELQSSVHALIVERFSFLAAT